MDRKLHLLESFSVQGSDGEVYKVCAYEHLMRDESLTDGLEHWEPTGELEYRLQDGSRLDVRRDGTMRIERTGVELKPLAQEQETRQADKVT